MNPSLGKEARKRKYTPVEAKAQSGFDGKSSNNNNKKKSISFL